MKKLIYEDVNLKNGFSYSIYDFRCIYEGLSKKSYLVYECNQNGDMKFIEEFISYDKAKAFVKNKCN